jgi:putative membrane protein
MKKAILLLLICLLIAGKSYAQFDQDTPKDRWTTAYSAGMMNAALGNIAKEKGTSQLVKDFGSKEAIEHMGSNEKLKAAVKNPMPLIMEAKHQQRIDRINNKDEKNFDKEYLDMVIKNHEEEIDNYEEDLKIVKDELLRNWLMIQVPLLKKHLEDAREIRDKL